jgi:magnesium-transporting ATPase (P-type)
VGVGAPFCRDVLLDGVLKPVSVAAMAVSFGTMDWISGGVIAALVFLNVGVGSYTEWQAEKASDLSTSFQVLNEMHDELTIDA